MFTSAENQKDFDVKLPMINYGSFGKSESYLLDVWGTWISVVRLG